MVDYEWAVLKQVGDGPVEVFEAGLTEADARRAQVKAWSQIDELLRTGLKVTTASEAETAAQILAAASATTFTLVRRPTTAWEEVYS